MHPDLNEERERMVKQAEEDGIEFFLAMFVDMHGKPCAKMVPAQSVEALLTDGAGFAGFAAGALGQDPSDPDLMAIPDPSSYTRLPWRPQVAVLHCDPHVEGKPWPYAPRVILRRQMDRLRDERGWSFKTGIEAEYMLVRRTGDGGIELADELDYSEKPCYEVKGLSRMWDHLSAVSSHLNELGWSNYANDHEDGNGQFEQNFEYADALTTADRAIFFRYMVHMLAHEAGMAATFMPKPFSRFTGNGLHLHVSLWDGSDSALFETSSDARGLGLSELAYQFMGGLIEHGRAIAGVICPTVNSYKRIGVGAPNSGSTWAPAYNAYGGNNRTVMLRVPEGGRIEHRGVDGSANPYLASTALLAAGMDGVARNLSPGEPVHDNLYACSLAETEARGISRLPAILPEAMDELTRDDVLRAALGQVRGGDYVDYFAEVKRAEFVDYHSRVSDWEINKYLTMF
ncbi:MAG: type III glutamate--ammonia ligase [Streptosporangiales bacterium]